MARNFRPSQRDSVVLAFAAEHRLVLERQIERLVGTDRAGLRGCLRTLEAHAYVSLDRVFGDRHLRIRPRGLAAIDSKLPAPRFRLGTYKHDVGLAWIWLAARAGTFGPLRDVISERQMRSHDGAIERAEDPCGLRLGGYDRFGNERLHYPDLLLIDRFGRRTALELELTPKAQERRERILGAYGADSRIARVIYLVEAQPSGRAIKRALEATARAMEVTDTIRIQLVEPLRLAARPARESSRRDLTTQRDSAAER